MKKTLPIQAKLIWLTAILITSFFTIAWRYEQPSFMFWDENYHIAAAQKYLNGVFFMEPHPPLGKLLVAAGEWILSPNASTTQFIDTHYAQKTPGGFSFAGYRFFPVLCAALIPALFFLTLELICGSVLIAGCIAMMLALDNAMLVHLRSAMLEGPQIFLLLCSALCCAKSRTNQRAIIPAWIWFGLAMATKVNSLVFAPILFESSLKIIRQPKLLGAALASCLACYLSVWWIHGALGRTVNPKLEENGYFKASQSYKDFLKDGGASLLMLPTIISDNLAFSAKYQRGVPRLNLCKEDENGSFPLLWPVGATSINYRWEREGIITRYLYLQINPAVWLISLAGALLAAVRSLSDKFGYTVDQTDLKKSNALLFVYFLVLAAPLMLPRVFYLYHFFCALIAGLALFAIELRVVPVLKKHTQTIALGALAASMAAFWYFSPLTYYQPMTPQQVAARNWLPLWDLHCVGCQKQNPIARPIIQVKASSSSSQSSIE